MVKLHALVKSYHRQSNGSTGARTLAKMVSLKGIKLSRYQAGRLMTLNL